MLRHRLVFVISVMAGLATAQAASALQEVRVAQAEPAPGIVRQRAQGVPMAPQPQDIDRQLGERDRAGADTSYRTRRDEHVRDQRGADRDLPMPRPVPSIIAP